jgi:hypothetical protein
VLLTAATPNVTIHQTSHIFKLFEDVNVYALNDLYSRQENCLFTILCVLATYLLISILGRFVDSFTDRFIISCEKITINGNTLLGRQYGGDKRTSSTSSQSNTEPKSRKRLFKTPNGKSECNQSKENDCGDGDGDGENGPPAKDTKLESPPCLHDTFCYYIVTDILSSL